MINHHIVRWIAKAVKLLLMTIMFIVMVLLLIYAISSFSSCRSVKSSSNTELKTDDSISKYKHDTISKKQNINLSDLLSAGHVKISIVYDTTKKINGKPVIFYITDGVSPNSILNNIINAPNQNVSRIDIDADNVKDSSNASMQSDFTASHTEKEDIKKTTDQVKKKDKSSSSYTGLIITVGLSAVALIMFYALFGYVKQTFGSFTGIIDAIKKRIK